MKETTLMIIIGAVFVVGIVLLFTMTGPTGEQEDWVIPPYVSFVTDDGVRCIWARKGYGGGLSCDFNCGNSKHE